MKDVLTYDEMVEETWISTPPHDTTRCLLGIGGEAGELMEKFKKFYRGDAPDSFDPNLDVAYELGDVLYYITKLAHIHDYTIGQIMDLNAEKLLSRKERGVIKGSGDSR
jgi:NTP pyrophosphatase (non-canonical NTP hydrolase)